MPLLILPFTSINSLNPQSNPARRKDRLSHVPSSHRWRGEKVPEGMPRTLRQKQEYAVLCHLRPPPSKEKAEMREGARKVGATRCLCRKVQQQAVRVTRRTTGDQDTVFLKLGRGECGRKAFPGSSKAATDHLGSARSPPLSYL